MEFLEGGDEGGVAGGLARCCKLGDGPVGQFGRCLLGIGGALYFEISRVREGA